MHAQNTRTNGLHRLMNTKIVIQQGQVWVGPQALMFNQSPRRFPNLCWIKLAHWLDGPMFDGGVVFQ
jgi:hypothetical protein